MAAGHAAAPAAPRKLWLDWQRGLAVLFMIEWHVVDAWRAPVRLTEGSTWLALFEALRFVGGFAAPGFLFMAGLSQALADEALRRRGVGPKERRRRAVKRALEIWAIAWGIRTLLFCLSFNKDGALTDLLKVDILDIIALSLLVSAIASVGFSRTTAALVSAGLALAIVLATPSVADALRHLDGSGGPWRSSNRALDVVFAYLYGDQPRAVFCAFNWTGLTLAGAAVAPLALGKKRPLVWALLAVLAYSLGDVSNRLPPVYRYQNFFRTSPSWFLMRLSFVFATTAALQTLSDSFERPLRWLRLLGRESLVAYVASVQLSYGAVAVALKGKLSFPATLAGILVMTVLTVGMCFLWERFRDFGRRRSARPGAIAVNA